ncbi:hypothetical protein FRC09_020307 [Ceratobasidium sp. 395]|nr:hypothetical protein FRC09_020307 [Ceratobasidium sp. 395]
MAYVNTYAPPRLETTTPINLPEPNEPYNLNFYSPVKLLKTCCVKAVPFIREFEEIDEVRGRREAGFRLFVTLNKDGLIKSDEEDPDESTIA